MDREKVAVFGAGKFGETVLQELHTNHYKIAALLDNDEQKWGKKIKGVQVYPPEKWIGNNKDAYFYVANLKYAEQIKEQIISMGITERQICVLDGLNWEEKIVKYKYESKYLIYDRPSEYKKSFRKFLLSIYYKVRMELNHPKEVIGKKYRVSLCTIFKDESVYLREWIEFHRIVGVDHFYMYDNMSIDGYKQILKPYIDAGLVTLIDWPYEQAQMEAYKHCIDNFKNQTNWIGFIDMDEFVVPIEYDDIYHFLRNFEKNRGSVVLYWQQFGTNGKYERNLSDLVTEDFVVAWRKHRDIGKVFYNTAYELDESENKLFHHLMWTRYNGKKVPPVNCFDKVCMNGWNRVPCDQFPIQINHYFSKSLSEWEQKMKKGDVYFKNNPHDMKYLQRHEKYCGKYDVSIYKYMAKLKLTLKSQEIK